MLLLRRTQNQTIVIDDDLHLTVLAISTDKARLRLQWTGADEALETSAPLGYDWHPYTGSPPFDQLRIQVVSIKGKRVLIGVDVPRSISVNRGEIHRALHPGDPDYNGIQKISLSY